MAFTSSQKETMMGIKHCILEICFKLIAVKQIIIIIVPVLR